MREAPTGKTIYRFGVFELDCAAVELRRDGKAQPRLREQTFQVLLMLLEKPREVIGREEFQKRLWSTDTFVDFDQGLNTAINQLRIALGDSAASPRFIQTVPRRGYRFIAPVELIGAMPLDSRESKTAASVSTTETRGSEEGSARLPASVETKSSSRALLSAVEDLPSARPGTVRALFSLIQLMYLIFYAVALTRLSALDLLLETSHYPARPILIAVIVTGVVGIPNRLYLLTAALFNYRGLTLKFLRLFPMLFLLDELWALAPFLIVSLIGMGSALAATAALLYLPFAQRSLLLMRPRTAELN